jgi:hypothetical protein
MSHSQKNVPLNHDGDMNKNTLMKKNNKIGILVKKPESNFSNGCIQQSLFLKQIFENIGYSTDFVTFETDYSIYGDTDIPINMINETSDLSMYKVFIFVSLIVIDTNPIYENIKKHNITCIDIICGNLYILHQEEFVFNEHNIISNSFHNISQESWVLEMYPFMNEYINFLTNKPSHILPYVWNTDIIEGYMKCKHLDIKVDYDHIDRSKINILIFEPNMSIHKTGLIPILIANRYFLDNPAHLNKVYVFCGNKIKENNMPFLQNLAIVKSGILETYERMVMPTVFDIIKKNNNHINVVLSHNIMNNLNFLHLELMHLGIPIIHNCEPYRDNGLYYDDYTFSKAVHLLEETRTTFYNTEPYRDVSQKIISRYSPINEERKMVYQKHIERVMGIPLDDLIDDPINDPIEDVTKTPHEMIMRRLQSMVEEDDVNETGKIGVGKGIVIFIKDHVDVGLLNTTLESLTHVDNNLPVEIVVAPGGGNDNITITEIKKIPFFTRDNILASLKYDIEFIHLTDVMEDMYINQFTATLESSLCEVLYVKPGYCFSVSPHSILTALYVHNENDNTNNKDNNDNNETPTSCQSPCRTIHGVLKYSNYDYGDLNYMNLFDAFNTNTTQKTVGDGVGDGEGEGELKHQHNQNKMDNDFVMTSDVFFVKKNVAPVITIMRMCQDRVLIDGLPTLDVVFSIAHKFVFDKTPITTHQPTPTSLLSDSMVYVLGNVSNKFEGFGYVHTDIHGKPLIHFIDGIARNQINQTIKTQPKTKMVKVSPNIDFSISEAGVIGFKGKAVGKRVPETIAKFIE